jgi:hypothetical protein
MDAIERMYLIEELKASAEANRVEIARRAAERAANCDFDDNAMGLELVYKERQDAAQPAQPAEELVIDEALIDFLGYVISEERALARAAVLASTRDVLERLQASVARVELLEHEIRELRIKLDTIVSLLSTKAAGDDTIIDLKRWRA